MVVKLFKHEAREWKSLKAKSRRYKIPIKKYGANVKFDDRVYAQLGLGTATRIMNARIILKKRYAKRKISARTEMANRRAWNKRYE